jgi:transcriptional regulator with XRE-family HTH domain
MARARKTTKSLRSKEHRALCALLIEAREEADLTQVIVAKRLGKQQSYVAKYEGGERRLDLVEFLAVARALKLDPIQILRRLVREIGQ